MWSRANIAQLVHIRRILNVCWNLYQICRFCRGHVTSITLISKFTQFHFISMMTFFRLENGRLSLWSMPKHGLKFEQPSFFDLFPKKVIIFVRFAGSFNKVKKNYLRACQHVIKEIHFWCFFFLFNLLSWFLADFITQCWVSMQFFGRGAKQMIGKYPKFKIKEEKNWISNIWKYEMTSCESENRHELVFRHYLNVQKSCVIISRPWALCARRKTKKW